MRIIAGEHRGRPLKAPKGMDTRPTTDRVRESMMSALNSACGGFDGLVVLDAFAGSGALGLESMSRGASMACLCEKDGAALRVIEQNVSTLGYSRDQVRVMKTDVFKGALPRLRKPFDLVLLDPPYAITAEAIFEFLAKLDAGGALGASVVICYEHGAASNGATDESASESGFALASRKTYGDTVVDIFKRDEGALS